MNNNGQKLAGIQELEKEKSKKSNRRRKRNKFYNTKSLLKPISKRLRIELAKMYKIKNNMNSNKNW